jgi:hypothetical protein
MKLRACAAGAFVVIVGIAAACSSNPPAQPPIDTSGSTTPSQGGSSSPTPDGSVGDGGVVFVAPGDADTDAANECLSGTCLGCCTPGTNICEPGNLNAQCGFNGATCKACLNSTTCIPGSGCE